MPDEHDNQQPTLTRGSIRSLLREAGLRPTRQRMELASILLGKGHRHVSAESLHEEVVLHQISVSLATVYNTLHQFTEAGLLREVAVDGSRTYFDTNTSNHHHFVIEGSDTIVDIPTGEVDMARVPSIPQGFQISRIDVVVRLRRIA